jgi:FkbM family methyltransferase
MQKIGDFWIPDIDAAPGRNLERSLIGFGERQGVQIDHLHRALELVPGRALVIDGGANVGAWTRLMAAHFASVHSFEPNPEAYDCLSRNVDEWGVGDKVTTYPNALSDRFERVAVTTKGNRRTVTGRITGKGDIESVTIDSLDLPECSFLKLDVEGYEHKALRGAEGTIARFRPWIMIENEPAKLPPGQSRTAAEDVLIGYGYALVEKIGAHEIDWLFKPGG